MLEKSQKVSPEGQFFTSIVERISTQIRSLFRCALLWQKLCFKDFYSKLWLFLFYLGQRVWQEVHFQMLTLIWVGFWGVCFAVGRREGRKINPCLKLVRFMLETWNLVRKYTHICSLRKYTFLYQDSYNFADVSIFCKNPAFFIKNSTFTQSNSMKAVLETFSFVFSFCKIKGNC